MNKRLWLSRFKNNFLIYFKMDMNNSDGFVRVALYGLEIKEHIEKLVPNIEAKVLANLLLKYLSMENPNDKKICACELLLEDLDHWEEIKEACYCLAYGAPYITYKKLII